MKKQAETLEEMINALSPDRQNEVRDFIEFLLAKQRSNPKFGWAGALKDLKDRYTSVELQHQIARWRIEGE